MIGVRDEWKKRISFFDTLEAERVASNQSLVTAKAKAKKKKTKEKVPIQYKAQYILLFSSLLDL